MLRSVNSLTNYTLNALDGKIGRCRDFLFDDKFWTVRYLVANTGNWLTGRKTLISPAFLGHPDWRKGRFDVVLTREQIENAPSLDEDAPVSRQYEILWAGYHGLAYYWSGPFSWGASEDPAGYLAQNLLEGIAEDADTALDNHLRSSSEVAGYGICASDADIGHVEDFILEVERWSLRYLVVDTRNWMPGRKVLISHHWIDNISWPEHIVSVDLSREQIRNSPDFDSSAPVNRDYESRLYDYYGRPIYWQ
jgi:hypothetical protein